MKGFAASLRKDLRLLFRGVGLAALLLPVLLLAALRAGAGDLEGKVYLQPFPIAVRDEDRTLMSQALVDQIESVELFSQVVKAAPGQSDEELFAQGCAAVASIPKDFFYTMYTMDNQPVQMTLNGEMPVEAALFSGVASSALEIVSTDQAVGRAVFRFCFGELSSQEQSELWSQTSQYLFLDTLGRQQVFDGDVAVTDTLASLELRLLACTLSLLCLFFPLSAAKTLPEERSSGTYARFSAAGGRPAAFLFAKYTGGVLAALPSLGLLLAVRPADWAATVLLFFLLFSAAFGFFALAGAVTGDGDSLQRFGNLVLLLSMTLGGVLFAGELLPGAFREIGRCTLPGFALRGLRMAREGGSFSDLLGLLWPLVPAAAVFGCSALALLGRRESGRPQSGLPAGGTPAAVPAGLSRRPRVAGVCFEKMKAMSGGFAAFLCLALAVLLCGFSASYALEKGKPEVLRIAVVQEENSALAAELQERLAAQIGVTVISVEPGKEKDVLVHGEAEGVLTIPEGYEAALERGERPELTYESASAAVSARAAREIIAGQAAAQQARRRGLRDAEERLGRSLLPAEQTELLKQMQREENSTLPLYQVSVLGGSALSAADPFAPGLFGMAALTVMLTVLTWAAWTGRRDARRVESRMGALPSGLALSYGSDLLLLFCAGIAAGLCALLPGGVPSPARLAALAVYTLCVSGLSLALMRFTAMSGRIDSLAPFIALITCLLGGCFGDVGQVAPILRTISLCTPQGLALRAGGGDLAALGVLALAGAVFLALGAPTRRARRSRMD